MKEQSLFDYAELLPIEINEIASIIGEVAAEKLIHRFGGSRVKVPKGKLGTKWQKQIIETIGKESAAQLFEHYGGNVIYIASCNAAKRELNKNKFLQEYFAPTKAGASKATAFNQLTAKYQIGMRTADVFLNRYKRDEKSKPIKYFPHLQRIADFESFDQAKDFVNAQIKQPSDVYRFIIDDKNPQKIYGVFKIKAWKRNDI
ncbi:Mor transcription activator family protein [Neisseriaceae bacterium B1]